jgi:hypothetical protein
LKKIKQGETRIPIQTQVFLYTHDGENKGNLRENVVESLIQELTMKSWIKGNKVVEPITRQVQGSAGAFEKMPFLVIVMVPSILFLRLILSGQVLFWGTSSTQFIPWLSTAWSSVNQGILPLWNLHNGMGAPLIANYQLAFFYPPIWLTFICYLLKGNPGLATGAFFLVYLHVIWAGLGMVFLTRKLKMKPFAQMVSGLAFALSGCFIARVNFFSMMWAIAWIPWIMLVCLRIIQPFVRIEDTARNELRRTQIKNYLFLIIVIAMQLLAGHAQVTWYTFLFAIVWMGFWGWQQGKIPSAVKAIVVLGVCAFIAVMLSAVQLIPTLEYLLQTPRASSVDIALALNYSYWPEHLLNFFSPEFFGNPARGDYWGFGAFWEDVVYFGFIPLMLVFLTIKSWFKKDKPNRNVSAFLWIVFGVTLLLALGKNLPIFPFLYRFFPTFNLFQAPARFMIIGVFCLILLAGYGVEYWCAPTGRWLYVCRLGVMAGVAILAGSVIGSLTIKGDLATLIRGLIFVSVELIIFCLLTLRIANSYNSRINYFTWICAAILVISGDLLFSTFPLIPTTDQSFYGDEVGENTAVAFGRIWIPANSEYDLKFGRFFRFDDFRPLEDWENIRNVNLPNTNLLSNINLVNNFDPFVPDRFQRFLDILNNFQGQKQIELLGLMDVVGVEQFNADSRMGIQLNPIEGSQDYQWYECVQISQNVNDSQEMLINLMDDSKQSVQNTLIVEAPEFLEKEQCKPAQPIKYESTFLPGSQKEIIVESSNPGWLMLSSTYYPGWIALMDGERIPIYPGMITFQSVHVPAGRHTIQFFYHPQSCYYGALLSGLTLLGMCVAFLLNKKSKKEEDHGNKNNQ